MKGEKLETWEELLNSGNLNVAKTKKIKKLVRKYGIPEHLRAKSWLAISGAKDRLAENEGMYPKLCEELVKLSDSVHILQIDKDLERTTVEGLVVDKASLRRVLGAYSVLNSNIGYCQSMNFIVSALLTVVTEEESFWILVSIVEYILPEDYYSSSMVGVQSDIMVFKNMLTRRYPRISNHLTSLDVRLDGIVLRWFLCLFVGVLPVAAAFKALDLFFVEGDKALFRVCLALFKINEKAILGSNDFEKIIDILIKMPGNVNVETLTANILSVETMPGTKITSMRKHSLGALTKPTLLPSPTTSPPQSPKLSSTPPKLSRNISSPQFNFSPTRGIRALTINSRIPLNGPTTAPSPLSPRRASPQSSPKQSPPSPLLLASVSPSYYIPPPPPMPPKSYFEETTQPAAKPLPPPLVVSSELLPSPILTLKNSGGHHTGPPKSTEESHFDKVLAGLPTSQPITLPKKSNSKLFRSPSSPVLSRTPPSQANSTGSTPSSPNASAARKCESPLMSSDDSLQQKRINRRAKIDHSDAIPVLLQVTSSPGELGNLKYQRNWGFSLSSMGNTSSCSGDAGGISEDPPQQSVNLQVEQR